MPLILTYATLITDEH